MTDTEPGIVGRDAEVMERFYVEVMGFTVVTRLHFDDFGTVLRLSRDGARLKVSFPRAPLDPPRDDDPWFRAGGWRYAALLLDDAAEVDAVAAACATHGGRVLLDAHEHRPGARMALVTDPEGNLWEILHG